MKKSLKEWYANLSLGKKIAVRYVLAVVGLSLIGIVAWGYYFIFQATGCA